MDYFFQEQRWTDTFLSLHVKKFKRIILFLLIAFSAAGAKAAGVPTSWKDVTFNENIRYSQWVINSRISDFYGNTTQRGFNTYDKDGKQTGSSKGNQAFDYVPGLVAKAILEAYANYSTFDWSKPWFYSVMNYAKEKTYKLVTTPEATDFSGITLDNMNACKMYFPLMKTGALSDGAKSTGETAIANVLTDMKKYNELYVIGNGSESGVKNSTNETVKSMFGGWFHKPSYKDQMWCDGLYMGAALLAQIVNNTKSTTNVDGTSDWNLITRQFTISWNQLYDSKKGLLYHAFTANPKDEASSKWAGISNEAGKEVYHSEAFWGRAMGWYFLALVDVLEQMPSNNSNRATLIDYLQKLAAGLAKYQDSESGCWYQVVDQKDKALTGNYLESSCTSLFAAAYLKAVRLGFLTSNGTYNYKTIGVNAFKGAVNQFMKYDTFEPTGTTVQLVHNCASAGLGGPSGRTGSREYYITGTDVGQTNTYTEGKVMGAFIMAATEYERVNPKDIRFSYDLAPTYTLAKGKSITAEALGSGTISYQWCKSDNTEVSGATSETFTPAESGSYYCKATSGSTTIQTSPTAVTVEGTDGIENGGSENGSGSTTVTINDANQTSSDITYTISSGTSWNSQGFYAVNSGATITVKAKEGATISQIKLTYTASDNNIVGGSVSVNTGDYTLNETLGTWTGSANEVVFTTTQTARIKSIEVTYTTGTAVLNPSDLAYTERYNNNNNNAWTPKANGTIDVSELVKSSSTGAYSITSEGDVATISGTTITALKSGTFTLSQAADDKYKAGSINITVRIGEDVTSDGSNAYSFTAQTTDVSDGMTITRKDITLTFGNDGFWSKPSANGYTGGQVNPKNITENIPTAGTFYKFAPTKSGSLAVKVKLGTTGTEGNYKLRALKVSENGTLINATLADGETLIGKNQTPAYEKNSYQDNITFPVKANTDYYVYVPGSKLGFYNFTFSPDPTYTVTFNSGSNGTCTTTSISQSSQGESIPLPDVTPADGYTFDGWYTDEALTSKVEGTTYTPTADITLYAKCSRITDLFKLSDVTSTKVSVDSKKTVDVTSENATVTGGSAQLYNGHSSAKDMILSKQINLNGSSASYLKITLDNTLKAGDEIIINPAASSFKLSAEESNSSDKTKTVTGSYVIQNGDAVVGKKVIYLYKGSNSLITDINITRYYPESDSRATFTYNGAAIAFSETNAGDKSAYTTTLEIGASKKGESITITPSTKVVGATIKQGESTVNGNITITAPSTIGQTTTSTYTVTSKDGTSTTTYEINVKLVKENVVLVYAQSDGKTEWIWDKNKDSTRPTFEQPTLKVYLANADGTKSEKKVTGIKYKSDVTDVATVNETTGAITIQENANGGAKIYAILEKNDYYNDTHTFFNILVKQGYSYSVADDASIANGPSLNQPVYIKNGETNLVKMTFGGWKWNTFKDEKDNNKLKSTYVVNEKTRTDEWKKPITSDESVIASIDGYKTSISGATDAVDESKKASEDVIYGSTRYGWFKPAKTRDDGYLETYPYSLPVRGAYMTFEPTQNGTLTVYILQNGAWNTNRSGEYEGINFNDGEIVAGEFRPHSFYICNQRGLNVHQFSPKTFNCTTKQKVKGSYYCDLENHKDDPKNIATWTEFKDYMSDTEKQAVSDNWNSGINGAQKIVRLDNGSYLAIEKGIVKYTFFVTANETYYLFSNFSKLGFCGANFVPSETVKPAADDAHKITLSDVSAYPTPVKVNGNTDDDKNKYAWKFGDAIKGYVPGFTIPLFNSIKLTRTFKPNQWTTLSLPFNLTQTEVEQIFGKGTQIIVFDKAETTPARTYLTFFYHEIQNVLPGYPYLIRPTLVGADGKQMVTKSNSADYAPTYTINTEGKLTEFTVYNKAINPAIKQHEFVYGDYTAKCTPSYCTANVSGNNQSNYSMHYENGDIFVSEGNGTVYISEGNSYGKGYRSYIDYTGTTTTTAKALSISFSGVEDGDDNGTTTEIRVTELADDVIQTLGIGGVYNLNGQKVADTTRNLPAGIYIVNGRKVVVK
ncbi:MAG: glycoside hydrolase family 88 protein [Prevotella sp.]|nr:glycoside hydrolase family 88 protein [Prevotella sp.]